MIWKYEKIIRELKDLKRWDIWPKLKDKDIEKVRFFASKYFKDTWKKELSRFDYDLDQLREFADLIDWETWYYWKGGSVPLYILYEFKNKHPQMQKDWEKAEKRYGVQYMRDMKKK